MTHPLSAETLKLCDATLRHYFPDVKDLANTIAHAAPLLAFVLKDRKCAEILLAHYHLEIKPALLIKNLNIVCDEFNKVGILKDGEPANPYYYRLPMVIGEFPRHTRIINRSIETFNALIETYHKDPAHRLDTQSLNESFLKIIQDLKNNGSYCSPESLANLVMMLRGWSVITVNLKELTNEQPKEAALKPRKPIEAKLDFPLSENPVFSKNTFMQQNSYPINQAGRLASKSHKLVVNAFGLKFGGHFDALATYTPSLIPLMDFYHGFCRELSLRMDLSQQGDTFKVALLNTLSALGMVIEATRPDSELSSRYVNPFCQQPQAFMTPAYIKQVFSSHLERAQLNLNPEDIDIISEHLNHTLLRMHFNPSLALGIGANDDGTVSLSNDAGSYAFEFTQEHASWAARFEQLSLHRQGPAQAKMDASKGVTYELSAAFITEFEKMSQLQPTEYVETIYNALIDNLVTDLFPHPDYFYNEEYKQYSKRYCITSDDKGISQLQFYMVESDTGIFQANGKLVPRHRRAGTIDVQPLARDHASASQSSRNTYQEHPLAAQQYQYARSMLGGVRGDVAYNPVGPDGFILDHLNGQVIKNADGSYLPLIGLMPKNFDKYFKQENELCASFVIRMMHSSRMMSYCPSFQKTVNRIKLNFLPQAEQIPELPDSLKASEYLVSKHKTLLANLDCALEHLDYKDCEGSFVSLVKNSIYHLRTIGSNDERFLNYHHYLISQPEFLRSHSREQIEKILRGLEINPPIDKESSHQSHAEIIQYLRRLNAAFYPKPSAETANRIREEAQNYLPLLYSHESIKSYFSLMSKAREINLSRRQSPGMLYGALKYGKATLSRISDLNKMHTHNFLSGYRNAEGGIVTEPTKGDYRLDRVIKSAAMLSALLQHDENPLKQIYTPFVRAYDYRSNYLLKQYPHDRSPKKTMIFGGLYASLGLVVGSIEGGIKLAAYTLKIVTLNLIQLLMKYLQQSKKQEQKMAQDNPLFLSAAPANEPGFKVTIAKEIQDTLLLEAKKNQSDVLIQKLRVLIAQIIAKAHPELTREEASRVSEQMITKASLTDKEWQEFYEPWTNCSELHPLLMTHQDQINSDFIAIVYRCLLSIHDKNQVKIQKQMKELYHLTPLQMSALNDFIQSFIKSDKKATLLALFSDRGTLIQNIELKFKHIQKLYSVVLQAFNLDTIRQILYQTQEQSFTKESTLDERQGIATLPYAKRMEFNEFCNNMEQLNNLIKEAQTELHHSKNPEERTEIENEIVLIEAHVTQIKSQQSAYFHALYESFCTLPLSERAQLGTHHFPVENPQILNIKDKAQRRWNDFVNRELQHQLLDEHQASQLFDCLEQNALSTQILRNAWHELDVENPEKITLFYKAYKEMLKNKNSKLSAQLAKMLTDFVNLTMNAIMNTQLDRVDYNALNNPLLRYDAIGEWLLTLYPNKEDFRSLLAQQMEQSFLDKALVRQIFIINCLEAQKHLTVPDQWNLAKSSERGEDLIIRKTGLQSKLRIYLQHRNAVKNDGSIDSSLRLSLSPLLSKSSPTFFYAMKRVKKKMSPDSSFDTGLVTRSLT